jgi:hypothetical protein
VNEVRDNRAARRERLGLEQERRRGLRSGGVQLAYLVVALGLGLLVPRIPIGFTTPSLRVTEALVATGASVVTFIGVVYSLLFLVVQFGTTTFTPRLNLFRDAPIVWHSFGFFAGIFVFSFTAAFSTGADEDEISGARADHAGPPVDRRTRPLPPTAGHCLSLDPARVDAHPGGGSRA